MNQAAPEGWYEDPSDPARLRWWDGEEWTEFAGDGPLVELADVAHGEVGTDGAEEHVRGLWELEAEAAVHADGRHPTTGSLSLAAALAAVTSGDVHLPLPAKVNASVLADASDALESGNPPDVAPQAQPDREPQPEVGLRLDGDLAHVASVAHVEPAPASAALAPAPAATLSIVGPSPIAAAIPIIRPALYRPAPSDLLNATSVSDTAAIPIQHAESPRPRRGASAWMIAIPIVWLLLSVPAVLAGWGVFAAALGLLPLLTGAYVATTGRPSWLRLASRQTGALLLAASLVLVVGGTIINKAVHPVLVVDTGMLGFAAPPVPEATWAGPSTAETDARQPIASTPEPVEGASPDTTPAAEVPPIPVVESPAPVVEPTMPPEPAPVVEAPAAVAPSAEPTAPRADLVPAPTASYANCAAVWQAGAAPIKRGDSGFQQKFDKDGDGTGCEKRPS